MFTLLLSVILVLAVLLILVILGQNSKGGAGAAFGGSATQIMGVTRTGNVLEKAPSKNFQKWLKMVINFRPFSCLAVITITCVGMFYPLGMM